MGLGLLIRLIGQGQGDWLGIGSRLLVKARVLVGTEADDLDPSVEVKVRGIDWGWDIDQGWR